MNDRTHQSTPRRHRASTRRQTLAALAATGCLVLVAGCGDDEPDAAATTVTAAPATTEAAPDTTAAPPTTAAPATTEAMPETTMADTTVPETTDGSAGASIDVAYCEAAAEINDIDGPPTLEQFRAYAELAPPGIADTAADVLAAYEEVDGDITGLIGDDDFLGWLDEIDAFEGEYCGIESEGEASTSKPDDPYCQLALELYNQDDFPTAEQRQAYSDLAPDEIAEPLAVLIPAFDGADGNFEALFEDPVVVEALGALEAFELEYCGIGEANTTNTEIDPNAMRVDIAATDYAFDFDVPTEAGRYSFVMQNEGAEPHILILLKLEDGAALDTVLASRGEEGVAVELESDLAVPGGEAVITADLDAGNWVLLCPIPTADETPHFVLGMIHEFTIG